MQIISASGGAASFAVAHLVCEKYGAKNVVMIFCDTLIENEDLYRFLFESVQKLGCYFIYLKDGRNPWQVYRDVRYYANTRTAHCSDALKKDLFRTYLNENFPASEDNTLYFGFDWKEKHRHDRAVENWKPYKVVSPLTEPPYYSRSQIFQIIDDYDIELPELYKLGFTHNNCNGVCPKAGQAHFKLLLNAAPDIYEHAENEQEKLFEEIPTMRPSLRMTVNKKIHYLTLKQFREHLQSGGTCDTLDYGGCGCFSD